MILLSFKNENNIPKIAKIPWIIISWKNKFLKKLARLQNDEKG